MRSGYKQGGLPLWWGGASGSQQSSSGPSQPRCGRVKGERRIEMVAPMSVQEKMAPPQSHTTQALPPGETFKSICTKGLSWQQPADCSVGATRGWERGRWWISHVGAALGQVLAEGGMAPAQSLYPAQSLTPLNSLSRALQESLPWGG